jgi:hypothetical protein
VSSFVEVEIHFRIDISWLTPTLMQQFNTRQARKTLSALLKGLFLKHNQDRFEWIRVYLFNNMTLFLLSFLFDLAFNDWPAKLQAFGNCLVRPKKVVA